MADAVGFGSLLRAARKARGVSQLALATEAGVSTRHLSFLETGRAQPSREMVLRLAEALDQPLRERNAWLRAAGFAAVYSETPLDDPALATLRRVLCAVVDRHDPFPALLIDRAWNVLYANAAVTRAFATLASAAPVWTTQPLNLVRLTLDPEGLRPWLSNWDEVAAYTMMRLMREAALAGDDPELRTLLAEARAYPDVASRQEVRGPDGPVLPLHLKRDDLELRLFTTVATIGSPGDITLEGLRLEAFVPADDASDRVLRELAADAPS